MRGSWRRRGAIGDFRRAGGSKSAAGAEARLYTARISLPAERRDECGVRLTGSFAPLAAVWQRAYAAQKELAYAAADYVISVTATWMARFGLSGGARPAADELCGRA